MFEETSAASQIREAAANTMTGLVEQFTRQSSAINRNHIRIEQVHVATQGHKLLANLADRRPVVLPEIRDFLEVRLQPSRQPDEFQIASAVARQPPRRLVLVEISADIKPQHPPPEENRGDP